MTSYNIIFAGTPSFAASVLEALLHSSHIIKAVYTQPDRPSGRGRKLTASAVKEVALANNLPIYQPQTLRDPNEQKKIAALNADLMIVVAYGLILPKSVLTLPSLGCINIHASLLPLWRGAAPIQRAILAGNSKTGITMMQMDEGLDTGPMLYQIDCPILNTDTTETLHNRLANLAILATKYTLENLKELKKIPQDNSKATYANKILKEEARIDWNLPAEELARKIRAFNPWPVAFTDAMRIWEAKVVEENESPYLPGTIIRLSKEGIDISTGKHHLRLTHIQFPGGKVLSVKDILNSNAKNAFQIGKQL